MIALAISAMATLGASAALILMPDLFPTWSGAARGLGAILLCLGLWDLFRIARRIPRSGFLRLKPLTLSALVRLRGRAAEPPYYLGEGYPWTSRIAEQYHRGRGRLAPILAKPRPVLLPASAFSQHMLILGTTQCGKTTLNELLSVQAILDGDTVIILNPKEPGRWLNWTWRAATEAGRQDRFQLVSLSFPDAGSTYNPLEEYSDATELADRVVIPLPDSKDAAPYRAFCHKVMHTVIEAMLACEIRPTFDRLLKYSLENMGELLRRLLEKRLGHIYRKEELGSFDSLKSAVHDYRGRVSRGQIEEDRTVDRLGTLYLHPIDNFQRMTNSLVPFLTKLSSDSIGKIMGVERGQVRWIDVVEGRGILYFDLAGMKGLISSEAVGRMIVSDLTSFIGTRYAYYKSRPRIHLFVDELSNVLTKEFLDILNKAAGSGLRVYAMAQSQSDPEAVLDSRAQAQRMMDNIRIKAQMQAADEIAALGFSRLCPKVMVRHEERSMSTRPAFFSTGHREVADFEQGISRRLTEREAPMAPTDLLQTFPRGEMLLKDGGDLWRVAVRALEDPGVDYLQDVKKVVRL